MKRLDVHLYLITLLTETAGFFVVFAVSRALAQSNVSPMAMGWIGGAYSLTYGVASVLGGRWADRFDTRKQVMAGGLMLALASAAVFALRPESFWSCIPYAFVGAAQGVIYTAVITWMSRAFGQHVGRTGISRSLIHFCFAWNIGLIIGYGGGGWIFAQGPRWPLVAAYVLAVGIMILAHRVRRFGAQAIEDAVIPTPDAVERQRLSADFMKLGWLAALGSTFCMGIIFHLLPALMVDVGIAPQRHGEIVAAMRLIVIASYIAMYFTRIWHHRFSAALASQAVGVAGMLLIAWASGASGLLVGMAALGLLVGYNYFASLYYSTSGAQDHERGAAGGMHEAIMALGIGAGSITGGYAGLWGGVRAPYLLGAAVLVGLAILQTLYHLVRAKRSP